MTTVGPFLRRHGASGRAVAAAGPLPFWTGESISAIVNCLPPPRAMMCVMSELDVIIIHIRAEQAEEYERLFAERELPRWRDYKERGAFLSARISRVAFGTDDRQDVIKYAIAVEVPGHAEHSEHDADPGFQEFNRLADLLQPEGPLVYGGQVLHAV